VPQPPYFALHGCSRYSSHTARSTSQRRRDWSQSNFHSHIYKRLRAAGHSRTSPPSPSPRVVQSSSSAQPCPNLWGDDGHESVCLFICMKEATSSKEGLAQAWTLQHVDVGTHCQEGRKVACRMQLCVKVQIVMGQWTHHTAATCTTTCRKTNTCLPQKP